MFISIEANQRRSKGINSSDVSAVALNIRHKLWHQPPFTVNYHVMEMRRYKETTDLRLKQ